MLAWTKQNTMQRAMRTVLEWPQSHATSKTINSQVYMRFVLLIYWRNFSREYFILFVKIVHVGTGVLKLHFQVYRAFDF